MNKLISKAKNQTFNLRVMGSSPILGDSISFVFFLYKIEFNGT